MERREITIGQNKIKERIKLYTHYTGEARRDAGFTERLAARLQASDDDNTQLSDHIENAAAEVSYIIAGVFTHCTLEKATNPESGEQEHRYVVLTPALYPAEATESLARTIENYITRRALQEWFMQHKPEEAAIQGAEAQAAAQQLRRLLTQRTKPVATTPSGSKNINI